MVTLGKGSNIKGNAAAASEAPQTEVRETEVRETEVDDSKAKPAPVGDSVEKLEKLDDNKIMEAMKKALTSKDVKPIFEKASLKAGAGKRMEPEHFVLALLETKKLAVTPEQRSDLMKGIKNDDGKKQSPRLLAILGHANLLAHKAGQELGLPHIESAVRLFRHEPFAQLFETLVPKDEAVGAAIASAREANAAPKTKLQKLKGTSFIDSLKGEDLTIKAAEGNVTAAVGRDTLIANMQKRLSQSEINSVLLVGDRGTGKTQIVEGFALQIAQQQAPGFDNARIINIDASELVKAAAGNKESEVVNKLKAEVNAAANADPKSKIILFIDEAHGLTDALKDAFGKVMSRGGIQVIAATMTDEAKAHFEHGTISDKLHTIIVGEPTKEETIPMVIEKAKRFEKFFGVGATAGASQVATELSNLNGKFRRPRAATDFLDLAFADMKLALNTEPTELRIARRELSHLVAAQKDVKGNDESSNRVRTQLHGDIQVMANNVTALEGAWKSEKTIVDRQMKLVEKIEGFFMDNDSNNPEVEKLTTQLDQVKKEIGALKVNIKVRDPKGGWKDQTLTRMYRPVLDGLAVASAISSTVPGAPPVAQLLAQLAPRGKKDIEAEAKRRVQGQDHILKSLADYYRIREAGLGDENRPIGVHLLAGLTGTGKTEACQAHAEAAFGPDMLTRIDCNDMQQAHEVAKALGSPPGYVG
ncbi:MAG TPA: AAA family ATPase, partial [Myxococcota bacterium]